MDPRARRKKSSSPWSVTVLIQKPRLCATFTVTQVMNIKCPGVCELWIRKGAQGSGFVLGKTYFQKSPARTEEMIGQDSRFLGRDVNSEPPSVSVTSANQSTTTFGHVAVAQKKCVGTASAVLWPQVWGIPSKFKDIWRLLYPEASNAV